ncbi:FAD-dependent oxidoreductase [Saccharomonospora cyanea]|uniref:2-polyprenyl-6-methoxyphenol hydroxylase-like oxidoreductase n=1 Tax=Saccharomonospora cyanea NA-134 TaxID=882082 RepID=H5XLG0_9PSEU|nr:FAD-dependent oxidoreductase [Saccharomonospora cyanea]EHR59829.1 2-polyprenyl-6-methoxyphenol hydroxylase-like oxidoreductase [Saccharomonospora cyanea NA-134]
MTDSNRAAVDVLVVGGGIGGLSAAYALSRQGLRVRVLEQAPEFGEVGAGLQIAPNCTRILHEYGLLEEVKSLGVLPSSMVMRDAVDGRELTRLDLHDLERRYGFPYVVIHRSDLHAVFLRACRERGVDLRTEQRVTGYASTADRASVTLADGRVEEAELVIAADGLHSVARQWLAGDDLVNSAYVAYRGAIPLADVDREVDLDEVSVHVGPRCHFVRYGLRGGEMLNQVAVFASPKALAGEEDWGTPDELDQAFTDTCEDVRAGIPLMWRDRWWRMFDRNPITNWVRGRVVLLGDAAHPPLQYLAQGAVMAIEDGWVLAQHVARRREAATSTVDWDAAVAAYEAVRTEHCRRVVLTARSWGELWHLDGTARRQRNVILRSRAVDDYSFVDWLHGPTALAPEDLPPMFDPIPLESVDVGQDQPALTEA